VLDLIRKLRRQPQRSPFPEAWSEILSLNFRHDSLLTAEERARLRVDVQRFIAGRDWEGCGGLEMTDEIRVTVAAQACLLTLGLEGEKYPDVTTILVYPSSYLARETRVRPGGVVHQYRSRRLGEAWSHGPVVLSWADALAGGRGDPEGRNVVFHEFAHKLDMRTGATNGVPRLGNDALYREWEEVMSAEYADLVSRSHSGEPSLLDTYGATHGAEFFACCVECFFERPAEMREQHSRLYRALQSYFRQDPASRLPV
jgi:MtfA peptidase